MVQQPHLNDHNKQEYPPMHTTEHIINQTMIRLFGCGRSISAHIERKKSKLDYRLAACPTEEEIKKLEEAGVQILTCGTCLNYYGLTEKLKVGGVTNMYVIAQTMAEADLVVRP